MENPLLLFDKHDPFTKFHFEHLSRTPPPKLYHYTSGEALIGIIETQYFYATERSYLNDPQEFYWGLDSLRKTLNVNAVNKFSSGYVEQMNIVLDELDTDRLRLFVLSLSANPDLLSQWRAYADDGRGVAIGLDGKVLRERAGFDEFIWEGASLDAMPKEFCFTYHLMPVIYDKASQTDTIIEFLDAAHSFWLSLNSEDLKELQILRLFKHFFQYRVKELLLSFKNPGYKEECEWRIVTAVQTGNEKIKYRYGNFGITPFVRINMTPKIELPSLKLPIPEIRIGPNSPIKKNPLGIEMLCGTRNIALEYSDIDYRT